MLYKEAIKVWLSGKIEELLNKFFLKFTYSSNKMENNETRLRDVVSVFKGKKIVSFRGNKKTIKEIENHKRVCDSMMNLIEEHNSKLSIDMIKKLHYDLMSGCFRNELIAKGEKPGEFKKGDYVVGLHDVGVHPSEVEENIISLIEEVNEISINEKNALKIVSYFHCWCM